MEPSEYAFEWGSQRASEHKVQNEVQGFFKHNCISLKQCVKFIFLSVIMWWAIDLKSFKIFKTGFGVSS